MAKPALEDMLKSELITGQEEESLLTSAWGSTGAVLNSLDNKTRRTRLSIFLLHVSPLVVGHTIATEFKDLP